MSAIITPFQCPDKDSESTGFTKCPNAVLDSEALSAQAKTLYILLLRYMWQKPTCFPSYKTLSAKMQVSENTTRKYMHELEAGGFVDHQQGHWGRSNTYYRKPLKTSNSDIPRPQNLRSGISNSKAPRPQNLRSDTSKFEVIDLKNCGVIRLIKEDTKEEDSVDTISNSGTMSYEQARSAVHPLVSEFAWQVRDPSGHKEYVDKVANLFLDANLSEEQFTRLMRRTWANVKLLKQAEIQSKVQARQVMPYFIKTLEQTVATGVA